MATVLLIIHMMIAASLVGVVLLQRSEGGALGMGGGGGAGGFLTGRGTANLLTRVTAGLAAGFFLTSILLTLIAQRGDAPGSIFDTPAQPAQTAPQTPGTGDTKAPETAPPAGRGGILDKLQQTPPGPSVPQTR